MSQGNSRGAVGVRPGTANASAYAPLRQPVFRALWIASLATNLGARLALVIRPRCTKWLISVIGIGLAAYFFLRR